VPWYVLTGNEILLLNGAQKYRFKRFVLLLCTTKERLPAKYIFIVEMDQPIYLLK
jgi:hypothetical protein